MLFHRALLTAAENARRVVAGRIPGKAEAFPGVRKEFFILRSTEIIQRCSCVSWSPAAQQQLRP